MENHSYLKAKYHAFAGHDNPMLVKDEKRRASLFAFNKVSSMIAELDSKNLITAEEKNTLVATLKQIYLERKANAYLAARLKHLFKTIG